MNGADVQMAFSTIIYSNVRKTALLILKAYCPDCQVQTLLPMAHPILKNPSCLQSKVRQLEVSKPAISHLYLHHTKVVGNDEFCEFVRVQ